MGGEFYFLLGRLSCFLLLPAICVQESVRVCVCFQRPFLLFGWGKISVLGHESSGCQTPSLMEAVIRALGAARS